MIKPKRIFFLIFSFIALCSTAVFAKTVHGSLEMMIPESDLIIIGNVLEVNDNSWAEQQRSYGVNGWHTESIPGSSAEVTVEKVIKGKVRQNKIIVRYLGTKKYWVEDEPIFEKDERVMLFLQKIEKDYYRPVYSYSGKVKIDIKNKVYVFTQDKNIKDGDDKGLNSYVWDGVKYYGKHLTVDECVEKIKQYMSSKKNEKK